MPFDSLPTKHPHAAEIAVLDRMAELLATPDRWCQDVMSNENGSFCLVGAMYDASDDDVLEDVYAVVRHSCGMNVSDFNDTHTHAEVLAVIARARRTFEGTV